MSDAAVADPVADPTPTPAAANDTGAPAEAPVVVSDPAAPVAAVVDPNAPPAEVAKSAVEYTLKLPETPTLSTVSLERTADFARAQGLSLEAAQAALELANTEAAEAVKTSQQALLDAFSPGDPAKNIAPGTEWTKQHDGFLADALADPNLGAGDRAKLDAKVALAAKAFEKFATPEFTNLLAVSGYGSHPELLRVFSAIGEAMSEKPIVLAGAEGSGDPEREKLYALYPSMRPKD